jgi:hypothetical protein
MSAAFEIATIDERDGCSLTLTAENQRDASKAKILGASMKRPLILRSGRRVYEVHELYRAVVQRQRRMALVGRTGSPLR